MQIHNYRKIEINITKKKKEKKNKEDNVQYLFEYHLPVFIIRVILSPFSKILPSCFLMFFLTLTSSASSRTKFMYSSNPIIRPSILRSFCSKSHIWMRALL